MAVMARRQNVVPAACSRATSGTVKAEVEQATGMELQENDMGLRGRFVGIDQAVAQLVFTIV